jgi:hypothetical protein
LLAFVKILEQPPLGLIRTIGFRPWFFVRVFRVVRGWNSVLPGECLACIPNRPDETERHAKEKSFNRKERIDRGEFWHHR